MRSMIRFSCPACQKRFKAPDRGAGRTVSCPRYGQGLLIPPPVRLRNKAVHDQNVPDSEQAPEPSNLTEPSAVYYPPQRTGPPPVLMAFAVAGMLAVLLLV